MKDISRTVFFLLGCAVLALGMAHYSFSVGGPLDIEPGAYNDARVAEAINRIFQYLEGSFGALIMVVAGILAIVSAALGQYRTSINLLVVAVGAFILRSLVATFFNDESLQ